MFLKLVSIIFGSRKCQAGSDNTFDGGVVREVEEERYPVERAILLEVGFEEARGLHVHTHRCEHDREVFFVAVVHVLRWTLDEAGLPADLGGDLEERWVCTSIVLACLNILRYEADLQRRILEFSGRGR